MHKNKSQLLKTISHLRSLFHVSPFFSNFQAQKKMADL